MGAPKQKNKKAEIPFSAKKVRKLTDVRGALADLAMRLEAGDVDVKTARALAYTYNMIGEWIKQKKLDQMSRRLERIEQIRKLRERQVEELVAERAASQDSN